MDKCIAQEEVVTATLHKDGVYPNQRAAIADLNEVAYLFDEYRVFYNAKSGFYKRKKFLEQRLTENESVIFVSVLSSVITGFVKLYPLFSSVNLKNRWLLNDLYIHKALRGQGFSIVLMTALRPYEKKVVLAGLC